MHLSANSRSSPPSSVVFSHPSQFKKVLARRTWLFFATSSLVCIASLIRPSNLFFECLTLKGWQGYILVTGFSVKFLNLFQETLDGGKVLDVFSLQTFQLLFGCLNAHYGGDHVAFILFQCEGQGLSSSIKRDAVSLILPCRHFLSQSLNFWPPVALNDLSSDMLWRC